MGADLMGDIPGWVTAIGTVVMAIVPVIGATRYLVVGPLAKRMDGIEEKAKERQAEIRERLNAQDVASAALKASIETKFDGLDERIRQHEQKDIEQIDNLGDKTDGQISALRRDVATANDQLVTHQRNDIAALGQRIDNLVGKVIETLAMLAGRKGSTAGSD